MLTGSDYATKPERGFVQTMIQRALGGDSRADHRPHHANRDVIRQTQSKQYR